MPELMISSLPKGIREMEVLYQCIEQNNYSKIPDALRDVYIASGITGKEIIDLAIQKVNESNNADLIKKTEDILSTFSTQVR